MLLCLVVVVVVVVVVVEDKGSTAISKMDGHQTRTSKQTNNRRIIQYQKRRGTGTRKKQYKNTKGFGHSHVVCAYNRLRTDPK
jgi:hypothetical protein